ncbi:MAG TPA: tRNA pseudouridine(38-40) synthase TruA [Steroidobacteraceae bacterium]|jgi:tRNA pseudouridine38-40 synthase
MPRIALGIEYDGSEFRGWQAQTDARGVQSAVEAALSIVADHPVEVTAAGRTDAGVHASMQVVHFDTTAVRSERNWALGANTNLPSSVSVLWVREVPDTFHARFSAFTRSYRYCILNRAPRPALAFNRVCWVREALDHEVMHRAAQQLVGEHDFSSFRAAECQARSPVRQLYTIEVERRDQMVVMAVTANAFLQHMVRNIAGVLISVGLGERPPQWVREVLDFRDRRRGGVTSAPQGLYLAGVEYPAELQLPSEATTDGWTVVG